MSDFGDDLERAEKNEKKEIVKEAIKEWLDDQVRDFGYWSVKVVAGALIALVLYLATKHTGWTLPTP